jgi:hypothetical protein
MKKITHYIKLSFLCLSLGWLNTLPAANQTETVSPILPSSELPFRIKIELADFQLPAGFQSGASGSYKGKSLLIAGRTNGLHGFGPNNNFPPASQNTTVFVVDPEEKTVKTRSLTDPTSGLTQQQIDLLSVTSPQFYQKKNTLYMCGGYGIDTDKGTFSTKDVLTAIDIPGLIHWVIDPDQGETAAQYIRHVSDPVFQITGGYMAEVADHETVLVFGQNFEGEYTPDRSGIYSEQIRRFNIIDNGKKLKVRTNTPKPCRRDPDYRRRDLNVVPVIFTKHGKKDFGLVAYSGVFTESGGIWTVPVSIDSHGDPSMERPQKKDTFKQGMNNYATATFGLFSKKTHSTYTVLMGGITYGFFVDGVFQTDPEIPFTNQCSAIKMDKRSNFAQYFLDAEFPVILSEQSNPGHPLLFGAGSTFLFAKGVPLSRNSVVKLDTLEKGELLLGYVVGGIQSSLPNTNSPSDSAASPYIFKVTLYHKNEKLKFKL